MYFGPGNIGQFSTRIPVGPSAWPLLCVFISISNYMSLVSIWSELPSRWVSGQDGNNVVEMVLGLDRISTAVGSAPSG
jgi:hypothetical protein